MNKIKTYTICTENCDECQYKKDKEQGFNVENPHCVKYYKLI